MPLASSGNTSSCGFGDGTGIFFWMDGVYSIRRCVRMFHVIARFGEHKEADSNKIQQVWKKKRHLGIFNRFEYWWMLETFLLSTSRKTTKGASNLPMCRAKHGVKLLDQLTCSPIRSRCFFQVPSVSWRTIMCIIFDQLKWFGRTTKRCLEEFSLAFRGDEMVAWFTVLSRGELDVFLTFFRMNRNLISPEVVRNGERTFAPKKVTLWCGRSLECRLKHSEHLWAIKILSSCQLYSRY